MGYDTDFSNALREIMALAGPDDDWALPDRERLLSVRAVSTPCRWALVITRRQWFDWVFPYGTLPADVMVFWLNGMVSIACARVIRRELTAAGCPLHFIGDLDPHDLSVYLSLRIGGLVASAPTKPQSRSRTSA